MARLYYGNVAGCHSRYCIKTTKPILKSFGPSGSPIIEAFRIPYADTKFQGEALQRGRYIHGGRENGDFRVIFDGYRRLSGKRCEIGRWLLWNVNRKSWVPDRYVSVPMTLSDRWPRFQGHDIFWSRLSKKTVRFMEKNYYRTLKSLIGNHT